MKCRAPKDDEVKKKKQVKMMKKNMKRIGGGGLSLDAFANIKPISSHYNPAVIKKQREFYKNAKQVKKFKKLKMQQTQNDMGTTNKDENKDEGSSEMNKNKPMNRKLSLEELYSKKREEKEKARMEKESIIQAKKGKIESAVAQRKATREKMLKRTRTGQPVMKYRIEHMLETIRSAGSDSADR